MPREAPVMSATFPLRGVTTAPRFGSPPRQPGPSSLIRLPGQRVAGWRSATARRLLWPSPHGHQPLQPETARATSECQLAWTARYGLAWLLPGADDRGEFVRLSFDGPVDLGGHVECARNQAPAGHPVPRPACFVLGNGTRFLQLDAPQVEVVGFERFHRGVASTIADEVRDIPSLVGVDAADRPSDRPQEGRIRFYVDIPGGDPGAVEERGRDQAAAHLLRHRDPGL